MNLPPESRFMQKIIPSKDWNFDRETQSRILLMLENISCQIHNVNRKKGTKAAKPSEQFQPEYVKKAKEDYERAEKQRKKYTKEEMDTLKNFMQRRNPNMKMLEVE